MAESSRRRSAATATVGLAGVGGAAALRHEAMVRSYAERSKKPIKRPPFAGELRMLKHAPGRKVWLGGAVLGAVSLPAAATGVHGVLHPKEVAAKRDNDSFWREGVSGAKDAVISRTQTATEKAPPKLVAGNYLAGAAVGSATGGLTHLALRKKKLPGHAKTALAATLGTTVGTAMLPVQSKLTARYSRGKYEVTPTGVRRLKRKARRPSSLATVVEGRPGKVTMHPMAVREQMGPVSKGPLNTAGAHIGAHWTINGLRMADKIDVPPKVKPPKTLKGKLVHTGRTKLANATRSAAFDVASLNDKDALARNTVHGNPLFDNGRHKKVPTSKRAGDEYFGQSLSRGQKRARVMGAGAAPLIGDFTAAGAAASMAPPELRKKTAALQFGGSMGGNVVGSAAGAYGLVHAAKHPSVKAGVDRANSAIDAGTNAVRSKLGMKPKADKGMLMRVAEHKRTPGPVRGALRPLAKNPKVAALGMLGGGMVGSTAGGWGGYGHALKLEEKRNARRHSPNPTSRHGSGSRAVAKRDARVLTQEDHRKQARKKKIAANVATFTGVTGTTALGALGGAKLLRVRAATKAGHVKVPHVPKSPAERLESVQTPLLTAGAGVGGLGSFNFAAIQRKEAKAEQAQGGVKKALVPRVPGIRRAPAMRRAAIRQTRYPGGAIRTSTVRGGLA